MGDDKKLFLGWGCQESIGWLEMTRKEELAGLVKKLLEGWS